MKETQWNLVGLEMAGDCDGSRRGVNALLYERLCIILRGQRKTISDDARCVGHERETRNHNKVVVVCERGV